MLAIFTMLIIVLAVNSIWAIFNFAGLRNSIQEIMKANYRSIVQAQNMTVAVERQDSAELAYLFESNDDATKTFKENEEIFIKWLSKSEDNVTESGEDKIIENINLNYTKYRTMFDNLTLIKSEKGNNEARDYYYKEILPVFEIVKEETRKLLEINQNAMVELKTKSESMASKAIYSTSIIAIFAMLGGAMLAVYLGNKVNRPIQDFIGKLKRISEGDYKQRLSENGDEEFIVLAKEFNIMAEKLQHYELLNFEKIMQEKQKAEGIVESISDGIILTDNENKILLVNRAAERILDIKEKKVLNKHVLESVKQKEIFKVIKQVKEDKEQERLEISHDFTVIDDKIAKHYRANATPILTQEEARIGVITLIQDITKLKEVDQMKSDFVSTVSHEFRTPLTSITMAVGLLMDEVPGKINEDQKELLEAIQEDGKRLTNLVTELLDLSRIESGKVQMDLQSCEVKEVINHAVKHFDIQLKEKNIKLIKDINDNLPKVKADADKIAWVINNLVSNALRFTPTDGSGKIFVKTKETANKLLISVSDNGEGIPEEYLKTIFDKFIQVKDKNGETTGGAGLGLAISKEIIKAHGGEIWATSELGRGSSFYFTLMITA